MNSSIDERFALYVKARQEGSWIDYLGGEACVLKESVSPASLRQFPPTITAASTHDPDVPYKMSKAISRVVPRSKCITVYGDMHDFDRDLSSPIGLEVYTEILKWLEAL